MLSVGSLFSGIGGFDLGFERAGMRTLWFCEQDPFCQRVLAKHWPGVPCHTDVRALVADTGEQRRDWGQAEQGDGRNAAERSQESDHAGDSSRALGGELPVLVPQVDVLCGGFPCQDISLAGTGGGIAEGERSGLWREFARLIGELRPRYVVVENVPALTSRGLDIVLADLAACGFDAEWDRVGACDVGAPHRRHRLWLVAYPDRVGLWDSAGGPSGTHGAAAPVFASDGSQRSLADASWNAAAGSSTETGAERERAGPRGQRSGARSGRQRLPESGVGRGPDGLSPWLDGDWEQGIPRIASGVPMRVDRLRALGNALVPQIAELIGERIVEYECAR